MSGKMYYDGNGVKQDYKKAFEWLKKAANCGDAYAQCRIGFMYCYGEGVEKNYEEGLKYFEKAAEQGNDVAIELLEKLNNQSEINDELDDDSENDYDFDDDFDDWQ